MNNVPTEAIKKLLNEAMAQAVCNGADSRSMPGYLVEIAAWLSDIEYPELPDFKDERVQLVYDILCDCEFHGKPREEHWEGWQARRIVAALATQLNTNK